MFLIKIVFLFFLSCLEEYLATNYISIFNQREYSKSTNFRTRSCRKKQFFNSNHSNLNFVWLLSLVFASIFYPLNFKFLEINFHQLILPYCNKEILIICQNCWLKIYCHTTFYLHIRACTQLIISIVITIFRKFLFKFCLYKNTI